MRLAWLVLAVCAAQIGCEGGVFIEVRPPPGSDVTEVELFLGLRPCGEHECPGIKPELGETLLPGHVYFRDDFEATQVFTGKVIDGKATFELQESALGDRLFAIAAVGYSPSTGTGPEPSAAALISDVRLGGAQRYIVELAPAGSEIPATAPQDGVHVKIWHEPVNPDTKCIGFERWNEGQLDERAFIVPKDDPDCDGFTELNGECNPLAHKGASIPAPDALSCARDFFNTDVCRLGGPGCVDGQGAEQCSPSNYCVPSAYCSELQCGLAASTESLVQCLANQNVAAASLPMVKCTLPMIATDPTRLEPCPNTTTFTMNIDAHVGTDCVDGEQLPLLALDPAMTSTLGFTGELSFTSGDAQALTFKAKHEGACGYRIDWSGTAAPASAFRPAFFRFTTAPEGGASTHLLLPLQLVTTECSAQPHCEVLMPSEAPLDGDLFRCAQP